MRWISDSIHRFLISGVGKTKTPEIINSRIPPLPAKFCRVNSKYIGEKPSVKLWYTVLLIIEDRIFYSLHDGACDGVTGCGEITGSVYTR